MLQLRGRKTDYTDAIVVKHAKTCEDVIIGRSNILYFISRTRRYTREGTKEEEA